MAAKLPFFPEGSQAINLAREWTPVVQDRVKLWEKNQIKDPTYGKQASVNGGRHVRRITLAYSQLQVTATAFNAFFREMGKVSTLITEIIFIRN